MPLEKLNPDGVWPAPGYNHVVKAGNTIYVAGQVGRKPDGTLAGADIESQTDQVFANMIAALKSVGADLKDLAKITVYLSDRDDMQGFMSIKNKYISSDLPTQTVAIVGLASPDFKVEVEAIAVLS